ncbi:MAG TPA: 2-C-methyl-D-erythritol 4-phosphate cytidylyltransferase [Steroidobacteraceae bacterium]|nr:2-C-methyl-D-erythritol 4-phosphate cytidylyltransferase [Steroidobacteraceae bacterium]
MRYWLVMPAAGVGRRFGNTKPKQYAPLQGRTVIEWALAPFLTDPSCAGISISLAADDPYWGEVAERLAKLPGRTPELIFAGGGVERSHSVRKGLAALSSRALADDWVLVHDAARPCLSSNDLQHLLDRLASHRVGGLLATPAADTLKRASLEHPATTAPRPAPQPRDTAGRDPEVAQTVDRAGLWRALTPQMFRYEMLCDALDRSLATNRLPTDEAQALEWAGEHPVLVQGSAANIKITSADDLVLAAALLNARESTPVAR